MVFLDVKSGQTAAVSYGVPSQETTSFQSHSITQNVFWARGSGSSLGNTSWEARGASLILSFLLLLGCYILTLRPPGL